MTRRRYRAGRPHQAGFMLIEAVIASTVFAVILLGVYTVYETSEANYATGSRRWDVQSQARVALERMAREVRMAGYASPTKLDQPIVIATDDTLTFRADLDGTGPQYITYTRRDCSGNLGTTLFRNVSTSSFCGGEVFVEGVTTLQFAFYELSNVPLPYPLTSTYQLDGQGPVTGSSSPSAPAVGGERDRVRQVKIVLTVQQQARSTVIPFTTTTEVALRNLIP
jgi:type II secretory pathway component PulJ